MFLHPKLYSLSLRLSNEWTTPCLPKSKTNNKPLHNFFLGLSFLQLSPIKSAQVLKDFREMESRFTVFFFVAGKRKRFIGSRSQILFLFCFITCQGPADCAFCCSETNFMEGKELIEEICACLSVDRRDSQILLPWTVPFSCGCQDSLAPEGIFEKMPCFWMLPMLALANGWTNLRFPEAATKRKGTINSEDNTWPLPQGVNQHCSERKLVLSRLFSFSCHWGFSTGPFSCIFREEK